MRVSSQQFRSAISPREIVGLFLPICRQVRLGAERYHPDIAIESSFLSPAD